MKKSELKRRQKRKEARRAEARRQRRRRLLLGIGITLAVMLVIALACVIYVNAYYRADGEAIAAFTTEGAVIQKTLEDGVSVFAPMGEPLAGFIFYPGGKVDTMAYAPLMQALADRGVLCLLVDMPAHLAVLDVNAADGLQSLYPNVENWYIGGHSLGGAMAASYLADNAEDYRGLLLLAAYSTKDLSEHELAVLSVVGSEDGVLKRDKYEKNLVNLPAGAKELTVEGGNHAGFGMYGPQRGDGAATITATEQILETADAFANMITAQLQAEALQ